MSIERRFLMNDIATRIAGLVNESGLSLRTLSKAIGVNHVSLSQWVTGKNRPSDKGLEALCLYFHVSPAWVLPTRQLEHNRFGLKMRFPFRC